MGLPWAAAGPADAVRTRSALRALPHHTVLFGRSRMLCPPAPGRRFRSPLPCRRRHERPCCHAARPATLSVPRLPQGPDGQKVAPTLTRFIGIVKALLAARPPAPTDSRSVDDRVTHLLPDSRLAR